MYQNSYQYKSSKSQKSKNTKTIIFIIAALIIGIAGTFSFLYLNGSDIFALENDESHDYYSYENGYTELIGYGKLNISETSPLLFFPNPSSNNVLLEYEVLDDNGLVIYNSPLIKPGEEDNLNVYSLLDEGYHSLTYLITSYDQLSSETLLQLRQIQEIQIIK